MRFSLEEPQKTAPFQGLAFGGRSDTDAPVACPVKPALAPPCPMAIYFLPIVSSSRAYNGEFTWVHGPWACVVNTISFSRSVLAVGSAQSGALDSQTSLASRQGRLCAGHLSVTGVKRVRKCAA